MDNYITQRIQDDFVFLSITDAKFLSLVRNSVKPRHFSSKITEDIINVCYSYYDQFKTSPGDHFRDEIVRFLDGKDNDKRSPYIEYLERLQKMDPPNKDYVISRINEFVRTREFEDAAIKFVNLTKNGKYDEARNLMYSALKSGIQKEEVGLKYLSVNTPTYYAGEGDGNEYLMPLGIDELDSKLPRGLRRTDFVCLLGNFKGGKSWFCSFLGKEGILRGLNVLHISHENSAEDTEMRYDMSFGGLKSYGDEYAELEDIDDEGNVISREKVKVGSVFDKNRVMQIRKRVRRFGGQLIIKKYPMGFCTMDEIRRYLDYLETFENFTPDIILNDYVEKMKLSTDESRRNEIDNIYVQSKGIADERKLLMVTVSQSTRDAQEKKVLGKKDFAEDIRKLGNVDLAIGISRTKIQSSQNRMQAIILANRHGPQDFGCVLATNFNIGQFHIKSWKLKMPGDDYDE